MNWPRLAGFAIALTLHGAAGYILLARENANALEAGNGTGNLNVVATVSVESGNLFNQEARQPSVEQVQPVPSPVRPPRETETEKPQPEAPALEQEIKNKEPVQDNNLAPDTRRPAEQRRVETASAAQDALEAQRAAASEAAHRSQLWSTYQRDLYSSLERHKVHVAKTGDVLLQITIAPSGKLLDRMVMQSSGIPEVDHAAIAALERSAPFSPIPGDLSAGPLTLTVPFRFRLH